MPDVVAHGRKETNARACVLCHLTSGAGHPESAGINGLPVGYFMRQLAEFTSGARKGARATSMIPIAKGLTEEDMKITAEYFAKLKPIVWYKVVETDTVPKTYIGRGNKRLAHPDGGSEPIGNRIIEIPEDEDIVLNRDPSSGFVAYVPKGSIAKGEALVTSGAGKTLPCAICHGQTFQGLGDVPRIAGVHPNYIVRQLWSMQNGERVGTSAALMKQVVDRLDVDDMLAIAAYLGSKAP